MFCRSCGNEIESDSNFCKFCGEQQKDSSSINILKKTLKSPKSDFDLAKEIIESKWSKMPKCQASGCKTRFMEGYYNDDIYKNLVGDELWRRVFNHKNELRALFPFSGTDTDTWNWRLCPHCRNSQNICHNHLSEEVSIESHFFGPSYYHMKCPVCKKQWKYTEDRD